jgi:hypothetical protein
MLDLETELEAIVDALDAGGIEYALCGGLAMAVHGAPRATIDIDLLIQPADEERVERAVASLGYNVKARPMSFDEGRVEIRRISKIDPVDGDILMLDLLLATPTSAPVWTSRETVPWRSRDLRVVSRDGLIELKRSRSSAQDLADIERLTS